MQDKAIRFKELKKIVPASRSTIFRWERDGKFPKHVQLGPNLVGWFLSEINTWLQERTNNHKEI